MVICSCNVLTDRQIAAAVAGGADRPREVYAACGCKAECGGCTGTVLAMVRDNVALAAK